MLNTKKEKGYFISVGAGKNQKILIEKANKMGYSIIAIDKNSSAIGFKNSDIIIEESILDFRKNYSHIIQLYLDEEIKGIGCRSYGKAILSTAYLSEKLNLNFPKEETVQQFYNKKDFNLFLSKNEVKTPRQISFSEKKKILSRLVYKPKSSEAKKGILIFENYKKLEEELDFDENYFLEEFIEGDEVTVLGFVQDKRFHLILLTDKITTKFAPFLEELHLYPSKKEILSGEISLICQKICNLSGLENSAFCAEFKITSSNEIYLIEAVPEIGGEYLADELLKNLRYDYFENYIKLMTKEKIEVPNFNSKNANFIFFLCPPEGKSELKSIDNLMIPRKEKLFFKSELKLKNEKLDTSKGNSSRVLVLGMEIKEKNLNSNEILFRIKSRLNAKF